MQHRIIVVLSFILLCSCNNNNNSFRGFSDEIRENFNEQAEDWNEKTNEWEKQISTIYAISDVDLKKAILYSDSIIKGSSLDNHMKADVHTVIGEILLDNDSIDLAFERFKKTQLLTSDTPRNKANKAAYYVKKGYLNKAMNLLREAESVNYDFKWLIGNLYEIQGNREKAIIEYQSLFQMGEGIYEYCKDRISELKNPETKLFTDLQFQNRRDRVFILFN